MPDVELPAWVVWLVSGAGLGGFLVRLLRSGARADLVAEMRKEFATHDEVKALKGDVNNLGGKVDGVITAVGTANTNADEARELTEKLEARVDNLEHQVMPQLEKINETLVKQGEHIARQTGVLETFMDEYRRRRP